MAYGFRSKNNQNIIAIDSNFKSFVLISEQVYHSENKSSHLFSIPYSENEMLVLTNMSHHLSVVYMKNGSIGLARSGRYFNYQLPAHTVTFTLQRYSTRPPTKRGVFNIYTPQGDLAFSTANRMLRPIDVWNLDAHELMIHNKSGEQIIANRIFNTSVGVVLTPNDATTDVYPNDGADERDYMVQLIRSFRAYGNQVSLSHTEYDYRAIIHFPDANQINMRQRRFAGNKDLLIVQAN